MNPFDIINKYYPESTPLREILITHSEAVEEMAIAIAQKHPELKADLQFIKEASLIHDIGIFKTDAPGIHCHGTLPYICHGYLGFEITNNEGFPKHALVCERHTGTGLSKEEIIMQNLPLPHRDMMPISIEEKIICFADTFFSKSRELKTPKTVTEIQNSLTRFGEKHVDQFNEWCHLFL